MPTYTPLPYSPCSEVKVASSIPHLSQTLSLQSNKFGLSVGNDFTTNYNYIVSISILPIIILIIGVVSVLLFQFFLCCRCCCTCIACKPDDPYDPKYAVNYDTKSSWGKYIVKSRRAIFGAFIFFACCALMANHALYFGNEKLDAAVNTFSASMDNLNILFQDLHNSGVYLVGNGTIMLSEVDLATPTCSYASSLTTYADTFVSSVTTYSDMTNGVPDKISTVKSQFLNYSIHYKNILMFSFYGVITGLVLTYLIVGSTLKACRSKAVMQFLIGFIY